MYRERQRTCTGSFREFKDIVITLPSWQVLRMGDGRVISVKETCPEDIGNDTARACQGSMLERKGKET